MDWRRIGSIVSGTAQVAMLVAALLAAIFGVYSLFQARMHHHF